MTSPRHAEVDDPVRSRAPPRAAVLLRPDPRAAPRRRKLGASAGSSSSSPRAGSPTARPTSWRRGGRRCARTPLDLWQRTQSEVEPGWQVMEDYQRWVLMRRITSKRQVLEVMTEFWENHLHVPTDADGVFTHRVPYGKALRAGALGKFSDLLFTATTHPAMGIYLNNAESTAESAQREPRPRAARAAHARRGQLLRGRRQGLGAHPHRLARRRLEDLRRVLLPRRPRDRPGQGARLQRRQPRQATVASSPAATPTTSPRTPTRRERIARRLAVKFVRDDPPQSLVKALAKTYLKHDTAIVPVLEALVASPVFAASRGTKVRDPAEDVIATWRALQVKARKPVAPGVRRRVDPVADRRPRSATVRLAASRRCRRSPTRPGPRPGRMTGSWRMHYSMAGGWWPRDELAYKSPKSWLPAEEGCASTTSSSTSPRSCSPARPPSS